MQKIQVELAARKSRAALLDTKRAAAHAELDAATEARQKMLLTGDMEDTKAALSMQARVDTATSALTGFDTAIKAQAALIVDTETTLAAERLDADRKAASDVLAAQTKVVDELLGPWLQLSRKLAGSMEEIHWRFESTQMAAFIRNAAGEVETASAISTSDLHNFIKAIRNGDVAIPPKRAAGDLS